MKKILLGAVVATNTLVGAVYAGESDSVTRILDLKNSCTAGLGEDQTIIMCPFNVDLPRLDFSRTGKAARTLVGEYANAILDRMRAEKGIPEGADAIIFKDINGDGVPEVFADIQGKIPQTIISGNYGILEEGYDCYRMVDNNIGICKKGHDLPLPYVENGIVSKDAMTFDLLSKDGSESEETLIFQGTYTSFSEQSTEL